MKLIKFTSAKPTPIPNKGGLSTRLTSLGAAVLTMSLVLLSDSSFADRRFDYYKSDYYNIFQSVTGPGSSFFTGLKEPQFGATRDFISATMTMTGQEILTSLAIINLFRGRHIFFLARDAERLGNIAKYIAGKLGDKDSVAKIHILDISRTSVRDPLLSKYLKQEQVESGINSSGIALVDTGFVGSLFDVIESKFPNRPENSVARVMLASGNDKNIYEGFFTTTMPIKVNNATFLGSEPGAYIMSYATLPKAKTALIGYEKIDGRIVPKRGQKGDRDDGIIDEKYASNLMDIAYRMIDSGDGQQLIGKWQNIWNQILNTPDPLKGIREVLKNNDLDYHEEGALRKDLEEVDRRYGLPGFRPGILTPETCSGMLLYAAAKHPLPGVFWGNRQIEEFRK